MQILTIVSHLIDYPTQALCDEQEQIKDLIKKDDFLIDEDKNALLNFVEMRMQMPLLDWQSEYDGLFERGRSLSLFLFEHLHGESRDRGQAMIDLIAHYKEAGLDIGVRELPDYIPLFLEFVSTQGEKNARSWLQDVSHILALLQVRLVQRESNYDCLFAALLNLAEADIDLTDLAAQVKDEPRDDTKEAIDKVWEEEMVTFGGESQAEACGNSNNKPNETQRRDQEVPIHLMDPILETMKAASGSKSTTHIDNGTKKTVGGM
ncbi:nitrate reductase molybdenum cofactor assembly chaperone [Shewanella surugensis]|uniref:Nitrate reductase molybdenum cofactor assembly chaperone n=1 Tax=Shewanella surugensis TaxID=212020 RepID=A0ABT0LBM8_9GAMM|nr:nitrate reductase molybdenum cofactor assembly chaperone [Shewanella surugensis]MCL1125092.1 nitrate reductase molybdenum cofactor assembly chaperone [Shewanella surugensis]